MIALDPISAAHAYLQALPQAARLAAAAQADADHWRTGFNWLGSGLILVLILVPGLLTSLRSRLGARGTGWSGDFLLALAFVVLFGLLRIPLLAVSFHLWPDGAAHPIGSALADLPLTAVFQAIGLFILLHCAAVWPRWWWAGLAGFAAVLVFLAVLVPPVALLPGVRHDQIAPAAASRPFLNFVNRGGLSTSTLFVFNSPDPTDVDMEGLWGAAHASVSSAALASPEPQTFAAIGHLLGHYRHGDLWSLALLWSGLIALLLFSVARAAPLLSRRFAPTRADDEGWKLNGTMLPAMGLIVWALWPIGTVSFNLFDQLINYRADDYALSLTHDPDGLCRWLIGGESKGKADPSALETIFFFDHPPLLPRLENAMRWKARHTL